MLQLERITSILAIGTSVVHEKSDAEVPYDHTHFAWLWDRAPNLHGARLMDVLHSGVVVHPHAVQSMAGAKAVRGVRGRALYSTLPCVQCVTARARTRAARHASV